ncbi:MAG: hypothetical protein DSO03_06580 [Hadesarchaea archaeon]|nr:MAG: hypothetical protein DSO03_06580 [Hadesarchaea archaeon]
MSGRKGQGAIEYLLILAAVLIVVAVAVYHVTRVKGGPPLGFTATLLDNGDVKIEVLNGGPIKAGDWTYKLENATDWATSVPYVTLEPGVSVILSVTGASKGSTLQIKHKTSNTIYSQIIM